MKNNKKVFSFDVLDKTTISDLLTLPTEELFDIQERATIEFEKSNYRKKWIDGLIELKYKSTINNQYNKAVDYFNSEPVEDMDKYNEDLTHYINEGELTIKIEFYRGLSETFGKPQVKKRISLVKDNKTSGGSNGK